MNNEMNNGTALELNLNTAVEAFLTVEKNKKAIEAFLKVEKSAEKSDFKDFSADDIAGMLSVIADGMDHCDLNSHVKNMTMIATSPMLKTMLVQQLTAAKLAEKLEKAKSETSKAKITARLTAIEEDILKAVMSVSKCYADAKEKGEIAVIKTAIGKASAELKTAKKEEKTKLEKELIDLAEKLTKVEKMAESKKTYTIEKLTDEQKDKFANSKLETFTAKIAEKVGYFVPNANKTGYKCNTAKSDSEKYILENLKSVINNLWLNLCQEDYEPVQVKKPVEKPAAEAESTPAAEAESTPTAETSGTEA